MTKPLKLASYHFSVRIVKLAQKLQSEQNEVVLSNAVLKNGTNIGLLIADAELARDSKEFEDTMHMALKEAKRTIYWLTIIQDTGYVLETLGFSLKSDCEKIIEQIEMAEGGHTS